MVPNALQAAVCDEQLMSIGGEIALSGNKGKRKIIEPFKKRKKKKQGTTMKKTTNNSEKTRKTQVTTLDKQ